MTLMVLVLAFRKSTLLRAFLKIIRRTATSGGRKGGTPDCAGNHLPPSLLRSRCSRWVHHWIEHLSGELLPFVNWGSFGGFGTRLSVHWVLSWVWQTDNGTRQHTKDGENTRGVNRPEM